MNYIEILNWIHSHKANGRRPSLERMQYLLALLDNPQDKFPAIHVVGTNGKGSTTSFLQHTLTASGYKTSTFTSPFIICFNERIVIDSVEIPDQDLAKTVQAIRPIVNSAEFQDKVGKVTEFKLVTALMFYYFAVANPVDIVVIGAEIGGTYDSTNVFTAKAVIRPSISIDHQETLGNSLAEIIQRKAGVLRTNVPSIFGKMAEPVRRAFYQKAEETISSIYELERGFSFMGNGRAFDMIYHQTIIPDIQLKMFGKRQEANASLAAMTALIPQRQLPAITPVAIKSGLEETAWAGRCKLIKPNLMLDGTHNEDSIAELADLLKNDFAQQQVHILFAGLNRKPLTQMLEELSAYDLIVTTFDFYQVQALSDYPEQCPKVTDHKDWLSMVDNSPEDLFVVTGSLYFIPEVRNHLLNH